MERKKGFGLAIAYDVWLALGVPFCAAYLLFLIFHQELIVNKWVWVIFLALAALYWLAVVVLGAANIVQSFRMHRKHEDVYCVNAMLVLKYGLVIFFIMNFVTIVLGFLLVEFILVAASRGTIIFAFPAWITATLAAAGFYAFLTWLAMLPGAFYGVQVVRFSRSEGKLSGSAVFFHGLLQFVFLADVLDAMYLAVKLWGMGKKSSRVIGGLYLLGVLAAATAVLFLLF